MNLKFIKALKGAMIPKTKITTLQINLGKKCNLTCAHCHVEAGPHRKEELYEDALKDILTIIERFPQVGTIDLTGGAPEMNNGFREIVDLSTRLGKKVIVRSNLTVFFVPWYEWLPEYFAERKVEVVASLPCYLKDNVDKMRGNGVFDECIRAIEILNKLGYGEDLTLNLVYNTPMAESAEKFMLAPDQIKLEATYKTFLMEKFHLKFNHLFTFSNIPSGRLKKYLIAKGIHDEYVDFLAVAYNPATLDHLMCKNQLSIDYMGNIFDCDFNQVEHVSSIGATGKKLTLKDVLEANNLDLIRNVMVRDYCFGCTAWAGCSCSGALVNA